MTTSHLTRSQRGMQIAMRTQTQWTPARIGIRIPSQRLAGVTYNTTLDGCSCADHQFRMVVCKHMLAARLAYGRWTAQERRNAA